MCIILRMMIFIILRRSSVNRRETLEVFSGCGFFELDFPSSLANARAGARFWQKRVVTETRCRFRTDLRTLLCCLGAAVRENRGVHVRSGSSARYART